MVSWDGPLTRSPMAPRDANIRHMLHELAELANLTEQEEAEVETIRSVFVLTGNLQIKEFLRLNAIYQEKVR